MMLLCCLLRCDVDPAEHGLTRTPPEKKHMKGAVTISRILQKMATSNLFDVSCPHADVLNSVVAELIPLRDIIYDRLLV